MRTAVKAALLVASLALSGCAGGDLGRARSSSLNDDMHRWIGVEAVGSIGKRASDFQLTDNERMLRDYAYPFIEPPHSRPAWKSVFGDYDAIPAPWRQDVRFDHTAYGRLLLDEPHRAHASRYAQLMEDVRNDLTRIDPFLAVAVVVAGQDDEEVQSELVLHAQSERERAHDIARMNENAIIVEWVQQCLNRRVASYRWALERLVIQAPDSIAADVDRLIGELAAQTANPPVAARPVIGRAVVVKG